jgi:hypothetical protein
VAPAKIVKANLMTPQASHGHNNLNNIFSPQDLSHSMALNPIGINFLTPMTTTTTWNKANLQNQEDSNHDHAIMSNPAAT